jgi:hypothetical protein
LVATPTTVDDVAIYALSKHVGEISPIMPSEPAQGAAEEAREAGHGLLL